MELLPPDLERIAPSLEIAFKHYPAMATAGIKRIVNGPFTFAPDGNPLVGPIRGVRNCWVACAVMAGLSQGGGVGLALANWMTTGDPQLDIWAMDVARFGDWANLAYTNAKVRENYSRRFRITFPNEELPAARPLHTTPVYDRFTEHNAVWGAGFGLEHPLWFQRPGEEPIEDVTFRRSNAFPVVAEECRAVRERVGLTECSNFAKYRVTGEGAADWLQGLFTNRLPKVGRIALTAMLNPDGRIVGEFSVARTGEDEFFLFGSQAAEVHHSRWFLAHLPTPSPIGFEVLALSLVGLSVAGPHARDVLQSLTTTSLATEDYPFMTFRHIDIGMVPAWVGRMTYTGDLGYEIWVAPEHQRSLFDLLWRAGRPYGMGAVRLPGADVDAHGEDVRHVVPGVPADLHAARGAHGSVPQARPRVHRAGGAGGRDGPRSGALDRVPRRRPRPRRAGRRHRRRADLAPRHRRCAGGRVGHVRCLRPLQRAVAGARLRARRAGPAGRRVRGRDHRPSPSGPPAHRARARSRRDADAGLSGPPPRRRAAPRAAGRRRRLPRRARTGRRLAAPDGRRPRRAVSTPWSTTSGRRRPSSSPRCTAPNEVQQQVGDRWLLRQPDLSQADLLRRWWRWMLPSPANLALVRLGIEAAALDATASGLPGDVRAEQIGTWRMNIEQRLVAEGFSPDDAEMEASLVKAMFTGLVVDLLATGERRRLTDALEVGLSRMEKVLGVCVTATVAGGRKR